MTNTLATPPAGGGPRRSRTVLPGDALQTLADIPGSVGLVLLDGRKSLCLPVLCLLEPKLAPARACAREPVNGYVSVSFPVEDGVEISSWTG